MEEKELQELEITKKLNAKQEAYMKVYGIENRLNASKLASRLMKNAEVNARIKELQAEMDKQYKINAGWLIQKQLWAIDKVQEGEKKLISTIKGEIVDTGEKTYDLRAYNSAIKNLADILGISKQQIEASITAKADVTVSQADKLADDLFGDDK